MHTLTVEAWKQAVTGFPCATLFHSAEWLKVLQASYGYQPFLFALGAPDHPRALLPVMEVSSILTGCRGVALPFTDACAPLAHSVEDERRIIQAAIAFSRRRGWKRLEVRGGAHAFPEATRGATFVGHVLDLAKPEKDLLRGSDPAVRRAIRKAELQGVTVVSSVELDAVRQFYRLMAYTRRRHGLPPQPFEFFENLHAEILSKGLGRVVIAQLEGRPIAGAIYLHAGKSVIYKYGASDERYQHVRGNNLVMWRAISAFAREGFTHLDFGRTSLDNPGLRSFKLSWGTVESERTYLVHNCLSGTWTTSPDRSRGWHNFLFRNLPLPLLRTLGLFLYRHLG